MVKQMWFLESGNEFFFARNENDTLQHCSINTREKQMKKPRYYSYQQSGNWEQEGSASSYHFTPFISIFSPLHIREEGASYLSCLAKGPPVFTQMCPLHIIWVHACLLTLHSVQNHFIW